MAIDLKRNKDSLILAQEKVINDKDETDWALFGYEGQTPALKVVGTGNGGIEGLLDELSSGKMMFAYCRIQDPNTGLFKFVLIHWTGEDVPENQRLKFTSHLRDVQSFFRSIHITIPAYCEDDIDKEDIVKRVTRSSGANYSFHKENAKPVEPSEPVGTAYQKVIPTQEISIIVRDQFWAKAEKDEQARQEREKAKLKEDKKRAEAERIEREMRETREREKHISEHARRVNKQRQAEKRAELEKIEAEIQSWEESQKNSITEEEMRASQNFQIRKDRAAELAQLISSHATSARDFFKQKSVEPSGVDIGRAHPPPRKINDGFGDHQEFGDMAEFMRETIIKSPTSCEHEILSKPARQPQLETEEKPETKFKSETEEELEPEIEQTCLPEIETASESESVTASESFTSPDLLLSLQESDVEVDTQDLEGRMLQHVNDVQQIEQVLEEKETKNVISMDTLTADQGKCACALYDYQAADDTEISFDPDDIITNIEEIDEGWWQGFAPNGSYGMFPSNYVELLI